MNVGMPSGTISYYSLTPGESVEVFNRKNVIQCRGVIQETAPELGVAWIRTDMGERRLLDIHEHLVRHHSSAPTTAGSSDGT